jgi:3-hydroxybutyryl-CoA dehydrogenase
MPDKCGQVQKKGLFMIDANSPDLKIGVIGAGAMGRGIAQVAAAAGCQVRLFDTNPAVVDDAAEFIAKMLNRAVEKGRMEADAATDAISRVEKTGDMATLADCEIVIEAVIEDMAVKQAVFRQLEEIMGTGAILATNTSSLSVTAIAAGCDNPERVAGLHFFNPVPMMKLVEVIAGEHTLP